MKPVNHIQHRFGIIAMQLKALVPKESSAEESLLRLSSLSLAGIVRSLADQGYRTIEIGMDMRLFFPHFFAPESLAELLSLKHELGLQYSVHLPLWSIELSSGYPAVRQASVEVILEDLAAAEILGPEHYILHATGSLAAEFARAAIAPSAKQLLLRAAQQYALESLGTILKRSGLQPRRLAIETVEFPFDLTLELAEAHDLSICLDVGHILVGLSGDLELETALRSAAPRLAEIHLHDAPRPSSNGRIRYGRDHRPLGSGDLDIPGFFARLAEVDFQGPLVFELQAAEALQSLQTLEAQLPGAVDPALLSRAQAQR